MPSKPLPVILKSVIPPTEPKSIVGSDACATIPAVLTEILIIALPLRGAPNSLAKTPIGPSKSATSTLPLIVSPC